VCLDAPREQALESLLMGQVLGRERENASVSPSTTSSRRPSHFRTPCQSFAAAAVFILACTTSRGTGGTHFFLWHFQCVCVRERERGFRVCLDAPREEALESLLGQAHRHQGVPSPMADQRSQPVYDIEQVMMLTFRNRHTGYGCVLGVGCWALGVGRWVSVIES